MGDMQKRYLIPMQKEAFLCSARCCDPGVQLPSIQQWCAAHAHAHTRRAAACSA